MHNIAMNLSLALLLAVSSVSSASATGCRDSGHESKIVGGDTAEEDRYSFAVYLKDEDGQFCGGTIISDDVVVSAAHCGGGRYDVVVGRHHRGDEDGQVIGVAKELIHPKYNKDTDDNDCMLLFLDHPVDLDYVKFASVTDYYVGDAEAVTAVGWGEMGGYHDDDISTSADELQEVELYTITNKKCEDSKGKIDGSRDDYHGQITSAMLCADHSKKKDTCSGDSGGPLVKKRGSGEDEEFDLVGIVSWGIDCAHKDFPGVYTRISAEYDWIRKEVCKRSSCPPAEFKCGAGKSSPSPPSSAGQPQSKKQTCDFDEKDECKDAGCCWNKSSKVCKNCADHARRGRRCFEYDGRREECIEEGCKWNFSKKTCTEKSTSGRLGSVGMPNNIF